MTYLILIIVYVATVFINRYLSLWYDWDGDRFHKTEEIVALKKDDLGKALFLWLTPGVNTFALLIMVLFMGFDLLSNFLDFMWGKISNISVINRFIGWFLYGKKLF